MLIFLKNDCTAEDADRVARLAHGLGFEAVVENARGRFTVCVAENGVSPDLDAMHALPGVELAVPAVKHFERALRVGKREDSVIKVQQSVVGQGQLTLIAGPCAVESEDQLLPIARMVKEAGANMLRGGAFKPRSSPYDFQGLGEGGLKLLAAARDETGLPIVTEAIDEASFDLVEAYADVVQIGARNMQNFTLLKRAGRSKRAILLKRGLSASLEDLLLAAEYVLEGGNDQLMLCERGIRTFSSHSRFTLDLSIIPQIKRFSHLPVIVDPSHASGMRESVAPLARAAVAAGADGVMIEVHPEPARALCDGAQSLRPTEFASLAAELRVLEPLFTRQRETVS